MILHKLYSKLQLYLSFPRFRVISIQYELKFVYNKAYTFFYEEPVYFYFTRRRYE